MSDRDLNMVSSNSKFCELLELVQQTVASQRRIGTTMEEMFRYNADRGEYGEGMS